MRVFTGAGTAMATPMNADGSINFDALEKMTGVRVSAAYIYSIYTGEYIAV